MNITFHIAAGRCHLLAIFPAFDRLTLLLIQDPVDIDGFSDIFETFVA
jgi:hypothetical protein